MNTDNLLDAAIFSPDLLETPSGWLGHLPFAAWIMKEFKPKIFVELGTHHGHSYFSFCQSVLESGLASKCFAVDTWAGDIHAGVYGSEIYQNVVRFNDIHYKDFSTLLQMNFDLAVDSFADGSIDLLHIDGLHTYEAVKHDFETWLPKLSRGAVVLFHDTMVRERNFGVFKFWEEIREQYSNHLEFTHSHGLGVIQIGTSDENKTLDWLSPHSNEKAKIIKFFSALGGRQTERHEYIKLQNTESILAEKVVKYSSEIAQLKNDLAVSLDQLGTMEGSLSWRITKPLRKIRKASAVLFNYSLKKKFQKMNFLSSEWMKNQRRLLIRNGMGKRVKDLARKIVRLIILPAFNILNKNNRLKSALIKILRTLPLSLIFFRFVNRIKLIAGIREYLLHEQVVSSYPVWSNYFDTPNSDSLERLSLTTDLRSNVFVVVHVDKASEQFAGDAALRLIQSVGQQWKAVFIFDGNCDQSAVIRHIKLITQNDNRIQFDVSHGDLSAEYIILIQGGALPRPHALRVFVDILKKEVNALVAYSDEDKYNFSEPPSEPWFKPQFSPLLVQQGLLLGKMLVFRINAENSDTLRTKLTTKNFDIAEFVRNYVIRLDKSQVVGIPHVLFHDALQKSQKRSLSPFTSAQLPLVSIIIPTRDRWDLLGPCLESLRKTNWPASNLEIIIVDNGSKDPLFLKMLADFKSDYLIKVIRNDDVFNWSHLNNIGAHESSGELLVFLNNDTEVFDPNWLEKLSDYALRSGVGAVGCKLLYPDLTVQHGGVVAGIHGVAGHAHLFLEKDHGGYQDLANTTHEVIALTGACLCVSRSMFNLVGGFNEEFRVAFNDTAFCFALHMAGKFNIYVGDPLFIHHESKSRGYDDTHEKIVLQKAEARKIWSYYPELMRNDPFYSPNLSLLKPYELSFAPRRRPAWDANTGLRKRVMILSVTHAVGHGVPVVIAKQAEALLKHGYEVIIAGPRSLNELKYAGCQRLVVNDPMSAASLALIHKADLIIAETPPFFSVARWTGVFPPVLSYDHGEPPADWFPDSVGRHETIMEKDQSLIMATAVIAISDAIRGESRTPVQGVIPLGNSHLGQWNDASRKQREKVRLEFGWNNKFIILNVCRFHSGERLYKGVDFYADVKSEMANLDPKFYANTIFVLCGKGSKKDVELMTYRGFHVLANVTDEQMLDLYFAADAYANFSKWEGYNLGIGQALAVGLQTIASDIPAHRAFGIKVTNNSTEAAQWLIHSAQNSQRLPKIWDWNDQLKKLVQLVDSLCEISNSEIELKNGASLNVAENKKLLRKLEF